MRALSRVIAILETVAGSERPLATTQVAARSGLSVPTVSRLLRDMTEEHLLDRDEYNGTFRIGPRMLSIGQLSDTHHLLIERARPAMDNLAELSGETCSLHVRAGERRICIAEVQGTHWVRCVVPVGTSMLLHVGVTGEVLMTAMSSRELQAYLEEHDLSPQRISAIRKRLDVIRRNGWGMAEDALEPGVSGISAPIGHAGTVVAFSVSGPSARWTRKRMRAFSDIVRETVTTLSSG